MHRYQNILDLIKIHAGRATTELSKKAIEVLTNPLDPEKDSFLDFIRLLDITISIWNESPMVHELLSFRHDVLLSQDYDDEIFKSESLSPALRRKYDELKKRETNSHKTAMLIRAIVIEVNNKQIFSMNDPMPAIRRALHFHLLVASLDQAKYIQPVIDTLGEIEPIALYCEEDDEEFDDDLFGPPYMPDTL